MSIFPVLFVPVFIASSAFAQSTWHVDVSAAPPGNGSAAQPFADLQFALAQTTTVSGDTLLVEPGTYIGPFDYLGKNVTVRSTQGAAVTILDGNLLHVSVVSFVNGEGPGAVLDGFTVKRGEGTVVGGSNPFVEGGGIRCVLSSPRLLNLTVTQNRRSTLYYRCHGGGMFFRDSAAVVSQCVIADNGFLSLTRLTTGAGIYCTGLGLTIENCTLDSNFAGSPSEARGGGLYGQATIRDCLFSQNRGSYGAGMYSLGATIERCVFHQNRDSADSFGIGPGCGGAIAHDPLATTPTYAVDCMFTENVAGLGGAVTAQLNSSQTAPPGSFTLSRCQFYGNRTFIPGPWITSYVEGEGGAARAVDLVDCDVSWNTAQLGGAVYRCRATRCRFQGNRAVYTNGLDRYAAGGAAFDSQLVECVLVDNAAELPPGLSNPSYAAVGGGSIRGTAHRTIYVDNRAEYGGGAMGGQITNCTFEGNRATLGGGSLAALYTYDPATAQTAYCSWCGNNPLSVINVIARGGFPQEIVTVGTTSATIEFSDVQGGYTGAGNFDAAPLYFAPRSGDFHLKPGSPCIDAGSPSSPLDPDGSIADVGAWPFDPNYCSPAGVWCTGKVNSQGCEPSMSFTGTPSVTGPDNFYIAASNFLGATFGLLAWSRTPNSVPFQGGTLCLQGPFFRAGMQLSTGTGGVCDGTYSFHFSQSYRAAFGISTYETIYAQWFARDVLNPDGTGWSLSNGIEFTICP